MKLLKLRLPALLAALILLCSLSVPALAAEDEGRAASAQTAAAYALQYGGAQSVQYAVWEGGEITLTGHAGDYSRTENRALTDDILYGIGSVSKTYTAAAVLTLAEAGKLSLDAPVTRYLPAFRMADGRYRQITVRMLLNHSSGLMGSSMDSAFLFADDDRSAAETLLEKLSTQRLKADPGAYSVYCNDGFTLAELVVEAVSGQSFMDYVTARILAPNGLEDTFAPGGEFEESRLAKTYLGADDRPLPADCLGTVGTGGLYATASDLAAFGGLFTSTALLKQTSLDAMAAPEYGRGVWPEDDLDILSFGLGWDSVKTFPFCQSGIQALVKGGDTLRYHAGLAVLPEQDLAVAVLSSGGSSLYNQLAAYRMAMDALAERGVTVDESIPALPAAQSGAQVPDAVAALSGDYGSAAQQIRLTVSQTDGTLTIHPLTYPSMVPDQVMEYCSDGSFRDKSGAAMAKFVTETNGRTYLYQKAVTPVPGLGAMAVSSYLVEKLAANPVSAAAQSAWDDAYSHSYLPMNEKYTSQVYLQMALQSAGAAPVGQQMAVPGYVGPAGRIVDETHTEFSVQIPGLYGRDGMDQTLSERGGVAYLTAGTSVYMEESGAPALFTGGGWAYSTVQPDGWARWYQVGGAKGKTMTVAVPENGGFWVYDAKGALTASSVLWGDSRVTLPEGGKVVFAGDPGVRFHLRFTA